MTLRPGRYRHFKGNEYTVLGVARHSETQEEMVVYRQEYGDNGLWVRPMAMFQEMVTVEGRANVVSVLPLAPTSLLHMANSDFSFLRMGQHALDSP